MFLKFAQKIQRIHYDNLRLYLTFMGCIFILLFLIFRNLGLEPFIFADEYTYSKSARLMDLSQVKIPSYIYFLLFSIANIAGKEFLEAARIINACLFILSFPFIYMVSTKVTTRNLSLFIAFFSLLDPLNSYTAYFMPEATYFLAFWVFCWFVISYFDLNKLYYGLISGGILALMSMIKPHAIFLLAGFAIFMGISHFFDKERSPLKSTASTIFSSFLAFFLIRFSLGYFFAGEEGLSIFGKFYKSTASDSFSFDFFYQLAIKSFQPFEQNILALVTMFSVPIAIVLNFNYSIKKYATTDDYQQHIQLFLISFLVPLLIITALFTAHVAGSGPYEIAGRLHMRYYNFVSPLFFIIAAGGIYQHKQLNIKNKKQWIIVSILLIISIYTIFFEKKNMLPYLADCPQWLGFLMNKTFFYVLSTLGILSLITYGINKKLGSKFYIYIFMPLFVFVSLYNIHVSLRSNSIATIYDQAGRVTKYFLKDNSMKIIVAADEAAGLFRTLFHIDNLKADILMLAPEASLDSSLVPLNTDYIVLIGNHPGLDNHPRLDFTDFSIIQMTNGVNIDFRKETFPLVKIEGLSGQEEWGRWSVGDKVKISFMTALPKKFTLIIKANAFGPNIQNDFKVTVGRETKKFRLTLPNDTISLDFNNVDNEKSIIIAIPKPTSPKQLGISSDDRLLGIGLIELKVHEK